MKIHRLFPLLLLIPATFAHAGEDTLLRVEQTCVNYPTPDARGECEKRQKEAMAAFEKDKKAKKAKQAAGVGSQKKNDLCFTRQSTGEQVCPN